MDDRSGAGRLVLVTGATGRQGGAVARHLLERGFRVRAVTRDPAKAAARALAARGAEVVHGDLDDPTSLEPALRDADGVFSVQNFWETGFEREIRQGMALADLAKAAGARHFVYSSVGSAHRNTGLEHFESKWQIEEHIRAHGLPHTVVRPTFFMENWEGFRGAIAAGTLPLPLSPDRSFQQIEVDDVGAFVAMVFENRDEWLGRAIDLASDDRTIADVADAFGRVTGHPVKYVQTPWDQYRQAAGEERTKRNARRCSGGSRTWAMRRTSPRSGAWPRSSRPSRTTCAPTAGPPPGSSRRGDVSDWPKLGRGLSRQN